MGGVFRQRATWAILAAAVTYVILAQFLKDRARPSESLEMQVALPRFVQVVMAGGDRYLAANIAGFRALVASTDKMSRDNFHIQGLVQSDAAWLNPAHEDNYYIAAAILPWSGEVGAAQYVLKQAAAARPFDWQPAFYYAFDELHFNKNPVVAAEWMRRAADGAGDEMMKLQLQQLAAQWAEQGEDLNVAIRLQRAMARESRHGAFAAFLEKRARRLENIQRLEQAVAGYKSRTGTLPRTAEELVSAGLLPALPIDPFGMVYVIDARGKPQLKAAASAGAEGKP